MVRSSFFSFEAFGVSSPFDPMFHYVTSPVFPPVVLGVLRLLFAMYSLTTTIFTIALYPHLYFSRFTYLSYIGLAAYFWTSGAQTIAFVLRKRKSYPLQTWPQFLQLLYVILYSTVIVLPIIVTAVFWSLIASPSSLDPGATAWTNISMHAINSFFALFEIAFSHCDPSPWTHLVPLLLILVGYLGVAYITRATQGVYVYGFLDPTKQGALVAAYIMGIMFGCCLVFSIIRGLCLLRCRIGLRLGYNRFEHHLGTSYPGTDDDQEELNFHSLPTES